MSCHPVSSRDDEVVCPLRDTFLPTRQESRINSSAVITRRDVITAFSHDQQVAAASCEVVGEYPRDCWQGGDPDQTSCTQQHRLQGDHRAVHCV